MLPEPDGMRVANDPPVRPVDSYRVGDIVTRASVLLCSA
jgi:hypothetical protein